MTDTYFIGYDARESLAAGVAAFSIKRRANRRTKVYMIEHRMLRRIGLFGRPWRIDATGQFFDAYDTKPFSTEFSHSRFLAFRLAVELKITGPCMFVDCDWLFVQDPGVIMAEQASRPDKIGVVMRNRTVNETVQKMDGMVQQNYGRKLWSALFTFTPSSDLATIFSPDVVNNRSGRELHGFMELGDEAFWPIPDRWHYIPSLDPKPDVYCGIHFSEFSPWLNPSTYADSPETYDAWWAEKQAYLSHAATVGKLEIWDDLSADLAKATA